MLSILHVMVMEAMYTDIVTPTDRWFVPCS